MRRVLITAALLFLSYSPCHASSQIITNQIPNSKIVGTARYSYMVFNIYDATLYAPNGQWEKDKPFALSLHYFRNLKGKKIAERSTEEIRAQGFTDEVKLASWYSQMANIFPDVSQNSVLTGVYKSDGTTEFYSGNTLIGSIKDHEFSEYFFGIWLSERTPEPDFRQKLIGNTK
jgi:hypothetical protein